MTVLERIVERSLGAFDGLVGCGQQLDLDDDSAVPSEWRAAFRLPETAGLAPEWIAKGREIDVARAWVQVVPVKTRTRAPI